MLPSENVFPPAGLADRDGLLGVGGDLSPGRLLLAYRTGIFPWFDGDDEILWWSPDPRMVLFPDQFRCSVSLTRLIKSGKFEVRFNTCFREVIQNCAVAPRQNQDGTWITDGMIEAYCELNRLGFAMSFESFFKGKLAGGLYGVKIGRMFFGESMFYHIPDASKVATHELTRYCINEGIALIDAQVHTPHIESLGGELIPRNEYLAILKANIDKEVFTL